MMRQDSGSRSYHSCLVSGKMTWIYIWMVLASRLPVRMINEGSVFEHSRDHIGVHIKAQKILKC